MDGRKIMEEHNIDPVYDEFSKILILGSFTSVKSRESGFFYGHPRNRFWLVTASVFEDNIPCTINEKKDFLLKHHIAVWDVIKSCDIEGSSDSSIKNVCVNDIKLILNNSDVKHIYVNGKKAEELYNRYILNDVGIKAVCLPSTSPANAAWNNEKLIQAWKKIIMGGSIIEAK